MSAPRLIGAALFTLTVVALALSGGRQSTPPGEPAVAASTPTLTPRAATRRAAPTVEHTAARSRRARYRLRHDRRVHLGGDPVDRLLVDGIWTRAPVPGTDRQTVRLTEARIEALSEQAIGQSRAAIDAPAQLVPRDGRLAGLGFDSSTPPEARDVLTALATALWFTAGEGPRWTVMEEDQNGRFEATYTRLDSETVRRTRRYLALRSPTGWNTALAGRITVTGDTTYHFDADGLARVVVDERAVLAQGDDPEWTVVELDVELSRLGFEATAGQATPVADVESLRHHARRSAVDEDRARLAGRTVAELLAELPAVAALPRGGEREAEARVRALKQLEAAARLEPGAVATMAATVAAGGQSVNHTGLVTSALAQAGTLEATAALIDLIGADLPTEHAHHVTMAAGLTRHPTAESLAALGEQVADPELGNSAALALGNSARTLGDGQAADMAVDMLLDRYHSAEGIDRLRALRAIANTGSPDALPVFENALFSADPKLAEAAAYGLRFVPGDDADALLMRLVTQPGRDVLRAEAARATAYRDPLVWRPILEGALRAGAGEALRQRIEQVLSRWSA